MTTIDSVIHQGMSLAAAKRCIKKLGGDCHTVRRTREVRFTHPRMPNRPRANNRKKDAPLHIVQFLADITELS